jgi:hypothetical protein
MTFDPLDDHKKMMLCRMAEHQRLIDMMFAEDPKRTETARTLIMREQLKEGESFKHASKGSCDEKSMLEGHL